MVRHIKFTYYLYHCLVLLTFADLNSHDNELFEGWAPSILTKNRLSTSVSFSLLIPISIKIVSWIVQPQA